MGGDGTCKVDNKIIGTFPVVYEIIKNGKNIISPKIDEIVKAFKKNIMILLEEIRD